MCGTQNQYFFSFSHVRRYSQFCSIYKVQTVKWTHWFSKKSEFFFFSAYMSCFKRLWNGGHCHSLTKKALGRLWRSLGEGAELLYSTGFFKAAVSWAQLADLRRSSVLVIQVPSTHLCISNTCISSWNFTSRLKLWSYFKDLLILKIDLGSKMLPKIFDFWIEFWTFCESSLWFVLQSLLVN